MTKWLAVAALVLGSGCSVKSVGELESEGADDSGSGDGGTSSGGSGSSASASTSPSTSSSATSMSSSAEDTSAGDSGTDTTDDDSGGTTSACPPESVCDPQPSDQHASFVIDETKGEGGANVDFTDVPCTIQAVEGKAPTRIELECDESGTPTTHVIDVTLHDISFFNIYEGRAVLFDWVRDAPFWVEDYFVLSSEEGNLIIAGAKGTLVSPRPDFYLPVTPELRSDLCENEPPCNEGGNFIDSMCSIDERTGIEFYHGKFVSEVVLDGNSTTIDNGSSLWVRVQESVSRHEISCTDIPQTWYEWLIEDISEG